MIISRDTIGLILRLSVAVQVLWITTARAATQPSLSVTDKSIAVLPFADLSSERNQEYFSDGITGDIINQLFKIKELRVISHASVMTFKNTAHTLEDIAYQLKVAHILTGTVRKEAAHLRINVELTEVNTGNLLWSEIFDEEPNMKDVLAIQRDIALQVAKALKTELSIEEQASLGRIPTSNIEAYESYQQGLFQFRKHTMEGVLNSLPLFARAIELDSNFAEAYVWLAIFYISRASYWGDLTLDQAKQAAMPLLQKALSLDMNLDAAHIALGHLRSFDWDFAAAEQEYVKGNALSYYGLFLTIMGRFEEAEKQLKNSMLNDPFDRDIRPFLGITQFFLKQPDLAIQTLKKGIAMHPDWNDGYFKLGKVYLNTGYYKEAIAIMESWHSIDTSTYPAMLAELAVAYYRTGQRDKAVTIINDLEYLAQRGAQGSPSYFTAQIYAGIRETEKAIEWLEKAYESHDVEMFWLKVEPQFKSLQDDPRFIDLKKKIGFDYHLLRTEVAGGASRLKFSDHMIKGNPDKSQEIFLCFRIKNEGSAPANLINALITVEPEIEGMIYDRVITIGSLHKEEIKEVKLPVKITGERSRQEVIFFVEITDASQRYYAPLKFQFSQELSVGGFTADIQKGVYAEPGGNNIPLEMGIGKYYALIIGIDNYAGEWNKLNNAVNDAKALENMLRERYKFKHFTTLYDDQATRKNIYEAFEWLTENLNEEDNLLIYYSGHGDLPKSTEKGNWVPADARNRESYEYIPNSTILDFIANINSKHTLLLSDACFSGEILRGAEAQIQANNDKYYHNAYLRYSRQVISSGDIEPVTDGGKDGHSVFSYYLLKALEDNDDKFMDAQQLFNQIKVSVARNSNQQPRYGVLKNTGDEGGEFIFISHDFDDQ